MEGRKEGKKEGKEGGCFSGQFDSLCFNSISSQLG
jgi:hypothetical protein